MDNTDIKKKSIFKILLTTVAAILLLLLAATTVYTLITFSNPYWAKHSLQEYADEYNDVYIELKNDGTIVLSPKKEKIKGAIVFYQGAAVQRSAYIPVMARVCKEGYACCIPEFPWNCAVLETDAADRYIGIDGIENWFVAGHSLGGSAASIYAEKNPEKTDGLILLSSYVLKEPGIPVLLIYGDKDGLLNMKKALGEKGSETDSSDSEKHCIEGGNHAQMGDYGPQRGDQEATISMQEQWDEAAEIMIEWLNRKCENKNRNEIIIEGEHPEIL